MEKWNWIDLVGYPFKYTSTEHECAESALLYYLGYSVFYTNFINDIWYNMIMQNVNRDTKCWIISIINLNMIAFTDKEGILH